MGRAAEFLGAKLPGLLRLYQRARLGIEDRVRDPALVFRRIHDNGSWGGKESVSGLGSDLDSTTSIRRDLPLLLRDLAIGTLLDAPCGDLNWIKATDLGPLHYIGIDILPELTASNQKRFGAGVGGSARADFLTLDLTLDALPRSDLILCRHCFIHLSHRRIWQALARFRRSGAKYLLTTTSPGQRENEDVVTGSFRLLNLEAGPFFFPRPLRLVPDCMSAEGGDFLGLWALDALPLPGVERSASTPA